ncbi:hypothetical protein [Arcticibacter eurypsychrophilus]|uniref:hypothetical protein n=1 Tax=Arcticibacter eurypsychrophilus TaxID=1434752 RepID=UPI00084D22AF|nr:hypothetical protein [Arcticibacter eurypsychrophilus]
MKKTLSFLLLAFACSNLSYAQTEKGTKNLGFNFNYRSSNEKASIADNYNNTSYPVETTGSSYFIGPSFSYFIANKLEIGVSAGYGYFKNKVDYSQTAETLFTDLDLKQNQYIGTLFLRKHIMFTDQFGLRTGPFISYTHAKITTDAGYHNVTKDYSGGINLGIEYFPIKKIGIAANLADVSYNHSEQNITESNTYKSNSLGFNLTNSLNLSIVWVFGK